MAVAALVVGICSIVFDFIFVWLGLILGIVAIILGVMARKQNPTDGKATAGLVCGIMAPLWRSCAGWLAPPVRARSLTPPAA